MAIHETVEEVNGERIAIAIEVDQEPEKSEDTGIFGEMRGKSVSEKAADLFDAGMALARGCAVKVVASMDKMDEKVRPSEFQLQFGIKLGGKVEAAIVKTGAEAQLQVTMVWKNGG